LIDLFRHCFLNVLHYLDDWGQSLGRTQHIENYAISEFLISPYLPLACPTAFWIVSFKSIKYAYNPPIFWILESQNRVRYRRWEKKLSYYSLLVPFSLGKASFSHHEKAFFWPLDLVKNTSLSWTVSIKSNHSSSSLPYHHQLTGSVHVLFSYQNKLLLIQTAYHATSSPFHHHHYRCLYLMH